MGQAQRSLIVGDGDQRFDAVLLALVKHCVIECEALFVRGLIHAGREDARPGDGQTEAFEAHFAHQRDVFLIMMVKVGRLMVGVEILVKLGEVCAFGEVVDAKHRGGMFAAVGQDIGQHAGRVFGAAGQDVVDRRAASAFVPAAFILVGSGRAAPKEVFTKCHNHYLFLSVFMHLARRRAFTWLFSPLPKDG